MSKLRCHVFVCQNERPGGSLGCAERGDEGPLKAGRPSCAARGSAEVLRAFEQGLAARPELWDKVAVTPCGCLGPCFDGPSLVVYPDAVWYAHVTPADVAEIIEQHLLGGQAVQRLVFDWGVDAGEPE